MLVNSLSRNQKNCSLGRLLMPSESGSTSVLRTPVRPIRGSTTDMATGVDHV
jgi:hypothetical protein